MEIIIFFCIIYSAWKFCQWYCVKNVLRFLFVINLINLKFHQTSLSCRPYAPNPADKAKKSPTRYYLNQRFYPFIANKLSNTVVAFSSALCIEWGNMLVCRKLWIEISSNPCFFMNPRNHPLTLSGWIGAPSAVINNLSELTHLSPSFSFSFFCHFLNSSNIKKT